MIEKIKSIRDEVKMWLQDFPDTRDNDNVLISVMWAHQNSQQIDNGMKAQTFLVDFAQGKYTNPETIRRARQRMQELHPELRGKSYKTRQRDLEPEMRGEMPKLTI